MCLAKMSEQVVAIAVAKKYNTHKYVQHFIYIQFLCLMEIDRFADGLI